MKFYRVACEHEVEDVQVETLRDNQLNVASFSVPVGIESTLNTKCRVLLIEKNGKEERSKELGFINYQIKLDEGKMFTNLEISEELARLIPKLL